MIELITMYIITLTIKVTIGNNNAINYNNRYRTVSLNLYNQIMHIKNNLI